MSFLPSEDADLREHFRFTLPGHVGIAVGGTIGSTVASSAWTAAGTAVAGGVVGFLVGAVLFRLRDGTE